MSSSSGLILQKRAGGLRCLDKVTQNQEADLVTGLRAGDKVAFEKLFYSYCQALINFSWRFVKNAQAAENIVQDVFLRIWTNRRHLDPALKVKSYLYQAVKNQSLQQLRHLKIANRKENIRTTGFTDRTPEDTLNDKEFIETVYAAVAELPPKCRMIFSMNRFDHLTYAEIAEIQNISIKTVETQMGRALKFLRQRLAHFL